MEAVTALIEALAARPEILGIVALAATMGFCVLRRRPHKGQNATPIFDRLINAQVRGIYLLGAVLIIRELGAIWHGG